MTAKPRCHVCRHKRGPRIFTATVKDPKKSGADPRQHKKACDCMCHQ